jgi:hypothetical protein
MLVFGIGRDQFFSFLTNLAMAACTFIGGRFWLPDAEASTVLALQRSYGGCGTPPNRSV